MGILGFIGSLIKLVLSIGVLIGSLWVAMMIAPVGPSGLAEMAGFDQGPTMSDEVETITQSGEPPDFPPRISKDWDQALYPFENDPGQTTVETSKGTKVNSENVERYVMHGINEYRTDNGLEPWQHSRSLSSVSRAHSWDMSHRDFFAHVNPDGEEPWDRFGSDQHCQSSYGENLVDTFLDQSTRNAYGNEETFYTEQRLGEAIVEFWQESPPHNELLLMKGHDAMGVGVYITELDTGGYAVEVTLNVCTFNENDPPDGSLANE